jgi:hypothetical protein
MLTFVWNPDGFQVVDAILKGEMLAAAYDIWNILAGIVARRGERSERKLAVHADNARPHPAKVTRAFCDDNFLRIALHPRSSPDLDLSDFSCFLFGYLQSHFQSKDSNSGLQMNFFRESENFWTKSALALWKRFSGNGSVDCINRLDRCIAALQQMESTWNEVNNSPLSYSWQRSDLEMLIPSWDILDNVRIFRFSVQDRLTEWKATIWSKLPEQYLLGFIGISEYIAGAAGDDLAEYKIIRIPSITWDSMRFNEIQWDSMRYQLPNHKTTFLR